MTGPVIIRRLAEDENRKTGLGRYADNCQECLESYSVVESDFNLKKGTLNFLCNGLIRPFFNIMNADGHDAVFHATDELCGFAFPFIKGRKVVTVHHIIKKNECSKSYYGVWMSIFRRVVKHADTIIAISDTTESDLVSAGVPRTKIVRIDNRINPAFRMLDMDKEEMICCVGELTPRKNMTASVDAFAKLTDYPGMDGYRMTICGKGSEEQSLKDHIRELDLTDRVDIRCDMSTDDIVRLYNKSKLVFNTSLHEGLGLITLEAQRCGTPVLHLSYADIPKNVIRESIPCESPVSMGETAYELIRNPAAYEELRKRSKTYSETFGRGYKEKYLHIIDGGADTSSDL